MPHPTGDNYVVYIPHEGVFGVVVSLGAHVSMVRYNLGGIEYEVYMENDDFMLRNEDDDYGM